MSETKSEIRARIDELKNLRASLVAKSSADLSEIQISIVEASEVLAEEVDKRIQLLREKLGTAEEDLQTSIIKSHKALCSVKNMGEKEAYGHDPAMYYSLGICGEAGEMANAIVKSMRFGPGPKDQYVPAIESELPDVVIYSYVLAHTHDINLTRLVNKKVDVVIQRAIDGYYGPPMRRQ